MAVTINYDVRAPETHLVHVTQTFPATNDASRTFRMAAWIPGSYKIYDLARHVQDYSASINGKNAKIIQEGKDAWTVSGTKDKEVTVTYSVYCRDLTVDTSHVTNDHAHIFPITTTLYDESSRNLPHKLTVQKPRGWKLWSGLETSAFDGTLDTADNYDHLIDCPLELGPASRYRVDTFTMRGKKHRLVYWDAPEADYAKITKDVKAICEATAKVWGEVPYQHYTFITHFAMEHGGGLEHRNSTVLGADPLNVQTPEKLQTKFYPLVAHEYFHTWNVKRLLPEAFMPYQLQTPTYTDLLWLFEGFTTYYELPVMARAGVVDAKHWGKVAAEMYQYYDMALGRKRRPVGEASRFTWTLLYQPHEHNINRNVSYYTKGLWVGLCVDAALRNEGVEDGLDTVMRHLWKKYAKQNAGVPEDAFGDDVLEATGVDIKRKITSWTKGTTELPIKASLKQLGWNLNIDWKNPEQKIGLGLMFDKTGAVIERIPEDSPCYNVLQPQDEIIAVQGIKWSGERFSQIAATKQAGDEVELAFFREGKLRTAKVPLREKAPDKFEVKIRKGDAAATRRRKAWLGEME